MADLNRLLNQLTGAQGGDVRVRQGQEQNLGSILQGLAGSQSGGGGLMGSILGGLTSGMSGAAGQGAPAAGGTAGSSGMGGLEEARGMGDATGMGGRGASMASGTGGVGDLLSGALGPGGLLSGGMGKGALAAGLVGMLMKSGKPKKMMSSGLKLGGLALIGGLAYQAWRNHQSGQQAQAASAQIAPPPQDTPFAPSSQAEQQDHARAMIRAMVAAAKADGHIDNDEQQRLFEAIETLDLDADDKAFLMDELRGPLDIDAVARDAKTPELAAEMYVASLLAVDEVDPQERAYLNQLAEAMNISESLQSQLEAQVNAAREG